MSIYVLTTVIFAPGGYETFESLLRSFYG